MQHFASDNYAGFCPESLTYFLQANGSGHEPAYGDDSWTQRVCDRLRALFETDCEVFFVFNGTAANSLALAALCQSYHSVICHTLAHIETDECGGPEFFSNGSKLLVADGPHGKLTPEAVEALVTRRADIHYPKPKVVSLTQATEVGTVYSVEEIQAITTVARQHGLRVHMDGARFANAVAALDVHPADVTWRAGVDVLCFGGTKNGLPVGEAVVFFDRALAEDFAYRVKQAGQLASKMRFISAPWLGLLEHDVWLRNARHANAMATLLAERIAGVPGVRLMFPVQANAVFAELPLPAIDALRARGWKFYTFIGAGGCRFMCAWDTSEETVEALARDIRECCASAAHS
ncbi:low specificity L-threonine aldolase [Imbroritus primus]|uniref:Low specificity L-threonine aldolase n=1 Tax=Imbroritus primus TaxID=3058603 RepID=A0ACD3SKZ6_9BURK|nr:low specificity L-threonine aldolase [Burkholderiaceae bacterium PBA]